MGVRLVEPAVSAPYHAPGIRPPHRRGSGPDVKWKRDIWWILCAVLVVAAVVAMLVLSCPEENLLPQVYDVL